MKKSDCNESAMTGFAAPPLLVDGFPARLVKFMASRSCQCQWNGPMVERNAHWPSCMVGQGQEHLGLRVTWERSGIPAKSPNGLALARAGAENSTGGTDSQNGNKQ